MDCSWSDAGSPCSSHIAQEAAVDRCRALSLRCVTFVVDHRGPCTLKVRLPRLPTQLAAGEGATFKAHWSSLTTSVAESTGRSSFGTVPYLQFPI